MKFGKFLLLASITLTTIVVGSYLYARYVEPNLLMVNREKLENSKLEAPLKIVFFGDTHIGEFNDHDQLDRIIEKINAENADLVIFTGDLIGSTGKFSVDPDAISQSLARINATYGKVAVTGNHEYALFRKYNYENLMRAAGFTVLINDWLDISELNVRLLGLDDAFRGDPDLNLTDEVLVGSYNILLTHEPDIVDEMDINAVELVLAGHTHGGQISLPYLTEKILPTYGKKYVQGLFAIGSQGQTDLFVTKGTGMTKLPFRFMNVPEIVAIEIVP
ncbi:metallophosphoesterase [uncultured Acetobacterium sp.]|uniref:metallophosphoesterase n=1 Tax=uncultured Acetobacterium sp. TaxID=217139 RepID=UPI002421A4B5|nr:metallophosphoesterase [uncultured Acetobacterium sp.]MBU4540184.1 metallophosphoesterase [Bacillota bacterium]